LKWFVADVLAVSSRHESRRTKMLVGRSLSCCTMDLCITLHYINTEVHGCTEGNLVDLEWRSADCGAPWRRRPVHISARYRGAKPCKHLNTSRHSLNVMRCVMVSFKISKTWRSSKLLWRISAYSKSY